LSQRVRRIGACDRMFTAAWWWVWRVVGPKDDTCDVMAATASGCGREREMATHSGDGRCATCGRARAGERASRARVWCVSAELARRRWPTPRRSQRRTQARRAPPAARACIGGECSQAPNTRLPVRRSPADGRRTGLRDNKQRWQRSPLCPKATAVALPPHRPVGVGGARCATVGRMCTWSTWSAVGDRPSPARFP